MKEDQTPRGISRRAALRWGALAATTAAVGRLLPPFARVFASDAADNVVLRWNRVLLQAIRTSPPKPPVVARELAIVQTCIFDAWAAYDSDAIGTRLGDTLRRPAAERTLANKNKAISFAAYRALVDLFPMKASLFNGLMVSLGYDAAETWLDITRPSGIGNRAAKAVIDFRHHDGSNQLGDMNGGKPYSDFTGYVPVNTWNHLYDPNRWQPLRVADGNGGYVVQEYIGAHWGGVIPFAMTSGSQFRPTVGPETHHFDGEPSEGYVQQAQQILHYSASLTDTQKVIAEYWADGPNSELPPGHWCLFADYVSRRDRHDLDSDVKLFFALSNAVFDAGIAAWDAKRHYDSVRPVSAVHYLFGKHPVRAWAGPMRGTGEIQGLQWQPYQPVTVVTPPFPEYISGHSSFSAAAAEVLKRFTGSDAFGGSVTVQAGVSKVEPGVTPAGDVTLSWATFSEAADQAGMSRRYGGIHFKDGDLLGRATGRLVGALVFEKANSYIKGTAA